ncbi:cysteine hydrolase family protein [Aggregatilinea lenta]|uniref:cysteine hydrolase family protein n=1 Tax=Aggregatilinea lenta TaxID=913108 RepID=UPI0013C376E8|nr:cysteine hydrolase family protein [Aggregatilinea lenta]
MNTRPAFYHADRVGQLYVPDVMGATAEGQAAGLPSADTDDPQIALLLVDAQVDFVHADGALSVPGAVDDTRRTIDWLLRYTDRVSAIAASLDSHIPLQIFFPTWWVDRDGRHPDPYTPIACNAVDAGNWIPLYEPNWSRRYVHELETDSRKQLMIWPFHTMLGTPGHAITPALYEAVAYHSAARRSQPTLVTKGSLPKTEHYSILEPEVTVPDSPQGELNVALLDMLDDYDRVYVAGQAKSHCVLETLRSVLLYYRDQPQQIAKWYVLVDCMSSVSHPEIDFDAMANRTLEDYAQHGLKLVRSTDPLD